MAAYQISNASTSDECGALHSPNYPSPYNDNNTYTFNINLISCSGINISVIDFISDPGDYLEIYNSPVTSGAPLYSLSGVIQPFTINITNSSNSYTFKWVTDSSLSAKGFFLSWEGLATTDGVQAIIPVLTNQKKTTYNNYSGDNFKFKLETLVDRQLSYIPDMLIQIYSNHNGYFEKIIESVTDNEGMAQLTEQSNMVGAIEHCMMYATIRRDNTVFRSNLIRCDFGKFGRRYSVRGMCISKYDLGGETVYLINGEIIYDAGYLSRNLFIFDQFNSGLNVRNIGSMGVVVVNH